MKHGEWPITSAVRLLFVIVLLGVVLVHVYETAIPETDDR